VTWADMTLSIASSALRSSRGAGSEIANANPSSSRPEIGRQRPRQAGQAGAHILDQAVVARQRALQFGEFLALREQALGQRLLRWQHALAQALGEGVLADGAGLLEAAGRVEVELRPGALQVLGIDHAIEGGQFAFPDPLLQAHARNAKEMRSAGKGQPLGHPANIAKATVGRFQYFYADIDYQQHADFARTALRRPGTSRSLDILLERRRCGDAGRRLGRLAIERDLRLFAGGRGLDGRPLRRPCRQGLCRRIFGGQRFDRAGIGNRHLRQGRGLDEGNRQFAVGAPIANGMAGLQVTDHPDVQRHRQAQ
jgi:hypothetical protein